MIRVSASVLALLLAFSAPAVRAQAPVPGLGTYTYDGAGNVTATGGHTFHYDAFGRLKKASFGAGKSQEYIYDGYGNIVEVVTDGNTAAPLRLAVDPRTNRLDHSSTRATHADATYDASGNMLATELGEEFAYDGAGMVTAWKVGSTQKIHLYTAGDERLATITLINDVQQRTDWTVRDGDGKVLRRFSSTPSGTWTWEEDYIYRDGQLLAAEVPGPARTLHFHLDHLGTPRLITGNGGAQVAQHTYYPFGKELPSAGQDSEPMKFTGHERDGATLDYMHARYYMVEWGRFLSVDPGRDWDVSKPQSWNLYAYVRNNPINARDPDGRAIDVLLDAGSAAYGIGLMWKKALNGEAVTWRDNAAVAVDLGAAFVPGLTGGGTMIRAAGKIDDVVDATRASGIVDNAARGRKSEARVLESMGLKKNTEKITNSNGTSIPDGQDATRVVEVKDTQRVCCTPQIKTQREGAQATGREHVIVTGTKTKVSKPAQEGSTVIRRDDLGPPQ